MSAESRTPREPDRPPMDVDWVLQQDAKTGEWHPAIPAKPPRHWPWLQRIVDWLWGVKR